MADRITTNRPAHLYSTEVTAEVNRCYGVQEISDAAALTIASYWQGPRGTAHAFAELSTTGSVDYSALADAIAEHYDAAKRQGVDQTRELDMLGTWALNHPSRTPEERRAWH